jgi:hypothetical protein
MKRLILIAALIGLVSACGTTPVASTTPSSSPSTQASGFVQSDFSGGTVASSAVTTVRIGQHDGYDRFVIEFAGGVPHYTVTRQTTAMFMRSPRGDMMPLDGTAGVLIVVKGVANWTSYIGPMGFKPGYQCVREVAMTENFEGVQQWAIGVAGTPALRVFTLDSPGRLVVDVAPA